MNHIGIQDIGIYIPSNRQSNYEKLEKFGFKSNFLDDKIGVYRTAIKDNRDECSDLCIKAWNALQEKTPFNKNEIDIIIVATQNADARMPHAAAYIHGKLGLEPKCASFDISLGCSGFVYGLSTIVSFMKGNDMKKGILFTCDPYSKIIDPDDRNTSLIFGDAATATLITDEPIVVTGKFTFGTLGEKIEEIKLVDEKFFMNGTAVVKFVKRFIPDDIKNNISINGMTVADINRFILHQASKFMVGIITKDLGVDKSKVPFDIYDYGNTVSSSIPIILEKELEHKEYKNFLISGFGVGLSWASCVLMKI